MSIATNPTIEARMSDHDSLSADQSPLARVGFLGLGHMGTAMAANLVASGFAVTAYVRRAQQMSELQALGMVPTMNMADLCNCRIVVSMLPDDNAVRDVFLGRDGAGGIADRLPPGTTHLSMSTISTRAAAELARAHHDRGQGYVAAPVFGNPDAARARQLAIIVAGDEVHSARCRPLLDNLGRPFMIGSVPQHANLIKLLGNMMTATTLEVLGEVMAVLWKSGQDPQQFVDIMTDTMFGSRVHKIYGNRIVAGDYAPGLSMPLALKDVRLALSEAETAGVPMPSVGVVRDRMITAIARGHGALDWTALGLVAAEEAGL
jgi:3-hydroxyisobutyrate dehydrogenase-like beta-hydroxyacid dehydrogenase